MASILPALTLAQKVTLQTSKSSEQCEDGPSSLPYSCLILEQETKGAFSLNQITSHIFLERDRNKSKTSFNGVSPHWQERLQSLPLCALSQCTTTLTELVTISWNSQTPDTQGSTRGQLP